MFLFEGKFGNILHTGDCRLTPECLQNLPEKYLGKKGRKPTYQLDYVFLDCTFGRFPRAMPSKHLATRQVVNCIWKHPDAAAVYLTCDLLGQEEILAAVSRTFGSKIYVEKAANPECFHALTLTVPEILSQDPSSRFHLFDGFPKLYGRAKAKIMEAQANLKPEPLIIRPSAQWYACEDDGSDDERQRKLRMNEAVRDQFGVWHVCYTMHSSREELEWALQLLAPKWVISTTPSCMAMELDYVKKHCFTAQLSPNDPLWKLLDISVEASSGEDVSVKSLGCSAVLEELTQSSGDSQNQPVKISTCGKENVKLSSPAKRPPVTLFGRARLGLQESPQLEEKKNSKKDEPSQALDHKSDQECLCQEENVREETWKEPLPNNPPVIVKEMKHEKPVEKELVQKGNLSPIGSSRFFNARLRKLYRSMNVPVPQPLPALVDLLNSNKRFKKDSKF
ncbi:Metallo-beta-lactamase [Parasponia andersonii]|uniref:Metallo-beta-lactamase n=1 Tax=Parasponia andersonii TaxID=3476 RepID=A0A2P5AL47_PARAD|nr:Metallo-beta-lactamase [Parasponia andersonii]